MSSSEGYGPARGLTQQANRRPTRGRKPAGGRPVERRVRRHYLRLSHPNITVNTRETIAIYSEKHAIEYADFRSRASPTDENAVVNCKIADVPAAVVKP